MDWIVGIAVAAIGSALFLFLHFSESPLSHRFRHRWPTVTQKITIALLLGLSSFVAVTPRVPGVPQKIIVALVSASLIWAMSIHPGEDEAPPGC